MTFKKYWRTGTCIANKWAPCNLVGRANTDTATEVEGKGAGRLRGNEGSVESEGIPSMSDIHIRTDTKGYPKRKLGSRGKPHGSPSALIRFSLL